MIKFYYYYVLVGKTLHLATILGQSFCFANHRDKNKRTILYHHLALADFFFDTKKIVFEHSFFRTRVFEHRVLYFH